MKAKELRIGNMVDYNSPCKISQHDIFEIAEFEKRTGMEDNMYSPIPLTIEWFKKFNFDKNRLDEHNIDEGYFYSKKLSDDKYCDLSILNGDKNGIVEAYLFPYENIRIKYVHQLQNLYFAITGEELQYTQAGGV